MKKSIKLAPGFTLIEIMITLVIATLLGGTLYKIYLSTQRNVMSINETIDLDLEDSIIYNQLEKDLNGIFVPQVFVDDHSGEQKKPGQPPAPQQPEPSAKEGKKEEPKRVKKKLERVKDAIVCEQEGNLNRLSFITNNPLQVYGQSQPRIARVEYTLEPNELNPRAFKLIRKESSEYELDRFNEANPRAYVLADSIKNISFEFYAAKKQSKEELEKKKQEKEQGDDEDESPKVVAPEMIPFTTWNDEVYKEQKELWPFLPLFVKVELSLWFNNIPDDTRTRSYTFYYKIYAFRSAYPKPAPVPQAPVPPARQQQQARVPQARQPGQQPGRPGSRGPGQRPQGQRPQGQRPNGQRPSGQRVRPQGRRGI